MPGLQCARLVVPLDYAARQGKTITLGLLRRPASGPRIGSLMVNPGGPGASGMQAAASMTDPIQRSALGEHFDLVGFDPRGVGASQPAVSCLSDPQQDQVRAAALDTAATPAGVAQYEQQQQAYAHACASRTGGGTDMLAHMGSRDVASDIDILRSALGDRQLSYVGFSYGTRLGQAYAEQFPTNVRAMVLDGAVDPSESKRDQEIDQARGFQNAFTAFATWCTTHAPCPLAPTPDQILPRYQQLTRALLGHPVPTDDGRVLSYDDAITGTTQALYSPQYWPILSRGLAQLAQGHGRLLMALADAYQERDETGHYSNTQDAFTAVHCIDDSRITDTATLLTQTRALKAAAPFEDTGRPPVAIHDACTYWPVPPTPTRPQPAPGSLAPTLVISTTHDPATPYQAGVHLAQDLHARLLTNEATQHTAFLQGNQCIDTTTTNYLFHPRQSTAPSQHCP